MQTVKHPNAVILNICVFESLYKFEIYCTLIVNSILEISNCPFSTHISDCELVSPALVQIKLTTDALERHQQQ